MEYAKNEKALKDRWQGQIDFSVLSNYYIEVENQESELKESDTITPKSDKELLAEAKTQT